MALPCGRLELTGGTNVTYAYDELGERTKRTPTSGPATTYTYDQVGNLTAVSRPAEGETPRIEDSYTYNGDGQRASQTISGTTTYLSWDMAESIPLILDDGTNSYIYGPDSLPIEQIDHSGNALYLHHDQQGSTRMLTTPTGAVAATMTYDAYGNRTSHTGTSSTPLGYDAQYTSADTGLVYLRARVYDPTTAQFLTTDPLAAITHTTYNYAGQNPLTHNDPTGMLSLGDIVTTGGEVISAVGKFGEVVGGVIVEGTETIAEGINTGLETIAYAARYAAPIIDAAAWGACIASVEICGPALVVNFAVQQGLVLLQVAYISGYSPGLNEAAILTGGLIGGLGLSAVELSELKALGRAVLAGGVTYPQLLLDAAELGAPAQAAILRC